ncbi:MAG: hypothetical protein P8178_00180 [Candidatus Thiodiazotropha sp.]
MSQRQLLRSLVNLCKEKASGTLFFNLDTGVSARLVLNRGSIRWVAYSDLRGEPAIDAIKQIVTARMSFNPNLKLVIGNQGLPATAEIIKRLDPARSRSEPEAAIPVVTDAVSIAPPAAVEAGADRPFELDDVRWVLEQESMEYLGPMARILCADYLKSMPSHLSHAQVRQLIGSLMQDINNAHKSQEFEARVKKVLKIH